MKNIVKATLLLLIASLILTAAGCCIQSFTDDNGQAGGDNISNAALPTERHNDEDVPIRIMFDVLSVESIHDNLGIADGCVYYSWLEFVTPEQLEIARDFLGIPEGVFDDNALVVYAAFTMDREVLRYYDSIPFEDMPEDPNRIIVRMYEAYILKHMELRKKNGLELGFTEPDRISSDFGRVITDWR